MQGKESLDNSENAVENHAKKNIAWGTILGYISLFLSIIYGFFFIPWIISAIGNSDYGLFTISTSLISLFLIDFGLGSTTNAYLSKYRAKGDEKATATFISIIYKLYLFIDAFILVSFLVAYFLIDYIYIGLTPIERESFKTIFLISASFNIISFPTSVFDGILYSNEEFIWSKVIDIFNKVFLIAFVAISIIMGYGLLGLIIAQVVGNLLAIVFKYIIIKVKLKIKIPLNVAIHWRDVKGILFFSLWAAICSICSPLILNVVPNILGIVSNSSNIAVFGIIASIEGYVYTFGSIMGGFFLPKISRIFTAGDSTTKLESLAIKVGKIQMIILGLVEIGFICCGSDFIMAWLKDSTYMPAYWGAILIMLYQLVYIPELVFYTAMFTNSSFTKHLAIIIIIETIINLSLCFVFSYFYGVLGACFAIFIARTFELILENFFYVKDLKVNIKKFFSKTYLRFIPAFVAGLSVGLLLHFYLNFSFAIKLLIEIPIIAIVYGVFMLFAFPKEEIMVFLSKIPFLSNPKNPIDNSSRMEKQKKKIILPIVCTTIVVFSIGAISVVLNTDSLGMAGTYVFTFDGEAISSVSLNLKNNFVLTTFYKNGVRLAQPDNEEYQWRYRYVQNNQAIDSSLITSSDIIAIYNSDGGCVWTYYYFENCLYTSDLTSEYGNKQEVFIKK